MILVEKRTINVKDVWEVFEGIIINAVPLFYLTVFAMLQIDKTARRNMGISRFANFVATNLYETNWTLLAISCGVSNILNDPKHERVRRAQHFGDDDYASAITLFLIDIFNADENVGLFFVHEIISNQDLSQDKTVELQEILKFFSDDDIEVKDFLSNIQVTEVTKFIDITTYPDDFYKILIDEINFQYSYKRPLTLSILIRKLFENLIIDILRKKFGTQRLNLYYNTDQGRLHGFSTLLKNLDENKTEFHSISSNLNTQFIRELNDYREHGNSSAHSLDFNIKLDFFESRSDDIKHKTQFLIRILNNS